MSYLIFTHAEDGRGNISTLLLRISISKVRDGINDTAIAVRPSYDTQRLLELQAAALTLGKARICSK